jgi:hypothetical protein
MATKSFFRDIASVKDSYELDWAVAAESLRRLPKKEIDL